MSTAKEQQGIQDELLARQLQAEEDERAAQELQNTRTIDNAPTYDPVTPKGDSHDCKDWTTGHSDSKISDGYGNRTEKAYQPPPGLPPDYQRPSGPSHSHHHTSPLIEASNLRARDEQQMQNLLQNIQIRYGIYNPEIEPEHEADYPCDCPIHQYQRLKCSRYATQKEWSKAVMYPGEPISPIQLSKGEKYYTGINMYGNTLFSSNPYVGKLNMSPYPFVSSFMGFTGAKQPDAAAHATWIMKTIQLNNSLNAKAQKDVDEKEPAGNIWDTPPQPEKTSQAVPKKNTKLSGLFKSMRVGGDSADRKIKDIGSSADLRDAILEEERGRWPTWEWRQLVLRYQETVGMKGKIAHLRQYQPIQYLHLLRAGYFEPIPVAWANQASNPLKFSIEAAEGWRGITPSWRGYEDTAEERLYWVLNHREGASAASRLKPDFISALNMANERMARAVAPPPDYYDSNDVCHVQHKTDGYSKQVLPPAFRPYDRPETSSDDTMILLDTSGSMDFKPSRPLYDRYLIKSYVNTNQPKNKDLAKAIIRRFTRAMENHDHTFTGYDLVTFANSASYVGSVKQSNLDQLWGTIKVGGGTRVMTGWQKVKDLHFQKHSASATHHPVYGWQAGPETPILRLLLLLDGEATDMDEFELDLLASKWAHVTIFLIGVDGCPHHHRHANELQRISDVNPHVSFVDAQGNTPERFVTHELLKRHLGYDVTMREFEDMEIPPTYDEAVL